MKITQTSTFRRLAVVAVALGMTGLAHGSLIEVKFATGPISLTPPSPGVNSDQAASQAAFLVALTAEGFTPANFGGVSGTFYYESTKTGTGANPTIEKTYDGAVDSLSFTVANWFSQSLSNIGGGGNSGDIRVRNDSNGASTVGNVDQIQVTVACSPNIASGSDGVHYTQRDNVGAGAVRASP